MVAEGYYFLVVDAGEEVVYEVDVVVGLEVPAGRAGPGQAGRDTVGAVVRVTGCCVFELWRFWFLSKPLAIVGSPVGLILRPCVLYLAFGEVGAGTGRVCRRPVCDVVFGVIGRTPVDVTLFTGPGFGFILTALLLMIGSSFFFGTSALWAFAPVDHRTAKQVRSAIFLAWVRIVGSLAVCLMHSIRCGREPRSWTRSSADPWHLDHNFH